MAPGAPQTPCALSCTRKFVHEPAFCSQVSNHPRTRLSVTVADTPPKLHWGPAPDTLSAATGAGGRVPSPPFSPGTQHTPLPAATLGPTRPQRTPAGTRAGQAHCRLTAAMDYRSEGLGGACRGGTCSCSAWLPAAESKQPLQTASSGASTSMRLS